jgi:hypothetical protein
MNIIAKAGKKAEPALSPEQIRAQLAAAKAKLDALTIQQIELAERSVQDSKVEAEYNRVIADMAAVHGDVERFELALRGMESRAQSQAAADEAAEISGLRGRVGAILDRRVAAARAFESALAETICPMRMLAGLGREAWAAWPGAQPQSGVVFGADELTVLVAAELYKQGVPAFSTGGSVIETPMALPTPKAPTQMSFNTPEAIPSLATAIEQANTYAKQMLGGSA